MKIEPYVKLTKNGEGNLCLRPIISGEDFWRITARRFSDEDFYEEVMKSGWGKCFRAIEAHIDTLIGHPYLIPEAKYKYLVSNFRSILKTKEGILDIYMDADEKITPIDFMEKYEIQKREPCKFESMIRGGMEIFFRYCWIYQDVVYVIIECEDSSEEEFILKMKYEVLKKKKNFEKMVSEIKAYETFEKAIGDKRERISEEVRMYVWQRDGGKCVRCGSRGNLEYDHIIPVSKGGSNTERNIELLCEKCNRSKSDKVC